MMLLGSECSGVHVCVLAVGAFVSTTIPIENIFLIN
jgi:hypothetical protein